MSRRILAVAAHPDDEALGCGGTLARHAAEGDTVHVVFFTNGVDARPVAGGAVEREGAAEIAARILGVQRLHYLGLPDNRLDSLPLLDVVQALEAIVREVMPDVIYTHHCGDLNVDHRIAHQAVLTACRPQTACKHTEIYAFEVMSSTEWASPGTSPFVPQYHVDIGPYLQYKLDALRAYHMEMRAPPHSRSIEHMEALALHRGHSVGLAAAEAFMLVRAIR